MTKNKKQACWTQGTGFQRVNCPYHETQPVALIDIWDTYLWWLCRIGYMKLIFMCFGRNADNIRASTVHLPPLRVWVGACWMYAWLCCLAADRYIVTVHSKLRQPRHLRLHVAELSTPFMADLAISGQLRSVLVLLPQVYNGCRQSTANAGSSNDWTWTASGRFSHPKIQSVQHEYDIAVNRHQATSEHLRCCKQETKRLLDYRIIRIRGI